MFSSIQVGTYFGIRLFIHPTFWLLPLMLLLGFWGQASFFEIGFELLLLAMVFVCVVLHEYGHALTARLFGINTRDITLYPIGGVARLARPSDIPHEELLISLAGPMVNLAIIVLLIPVWFLEPLPGGSLLWEDSVEGLGVRELAVTFLRLLAVSNLGIMIFNLLPIFPMDGGRVLRSLLALFLGFDQATQVAVILGNVGAVFLGFLAFYLGNLFLVVMGFMVILAGKYEIYRLKLKRMQSQPFSTPHQSEAFTQSSLQQGTMVWDADQQRWVFLPKDSM